MHKNLLLSLLGFLFLFSAIPAQAQWMNVPPTVAPNPPLECNNVTVNLDWTLGCINWTVNGYAHTVTPDTVFIDIDITGSPICFGALSFFNHTETVGNIPAGTYTLKIRSNVSGVMASMGTYPLVIGSCCSVDASFASNTNQLQVCPGGSLTFHATDTSLLSYNWTLDGAPVGTGLQTVQTFNQPGTYSLSLETSDGSCTDSTVQTIVVAEPILSLSSVDESCPGFGDGSINLQVSAGLPPYTYTWSNGANSQDISLLSAGTYIVNVQDSLGCSATDTATLVSGIPVTANFTSSATLICAGDSIAFTNTSSGATMSRWYVNGSLVIQTASPTLPFAVGGSYSVSLISENTTCQDTAVAMIVVSDPPFLSGMTVEETCLNSADGSIDLMVSGGIAPYSYSWSNGAITEDLPQLGTGIYTVIVADSLGCSESQTFQVSQGPGITASYTFSDSTAICEGTTVAFANSSSGGSSLNWFNNGQAFSQMPTPSLSFPVAGTYTIKLVIADNLCTDSTELAFTVSTAPSLTSTLSNVVCPDDRNGAIDLSLTGGSLPFEFDWNHGPASEDLSGLDKGTYIVNITDGVGCVVRDTFELVTLGGLTAGFSHIVGGPSVQLTDLSDTTAVSWEWDFGDGNTSNSQSPLHTYSVFGAYDVCLRVTDAFGCQDSICERVSISTGIDPEQLFPLTLYPNPTKDQVVISLPHTYGKPLSIEVFDALGRRVLEKRITAQPEMSISLGSLSPGVYQVLVSTENRYYQAKLIKE